MRKHPTPVEDIALSLIFGVMGEERVNRTYDDYVKIAAALPPLKVLTFKVNQLLRQIHECARRDGVPLPELCRFKAGHQRITYEPYPMAISIETVRTALEAYGMREPRWRKANRL